MEKQKWIEGLEKQKAEIKKEMEKHKILDLEPSFEQTKSKSKNKCMSEVMVRILF